MSYLEELLPKYRKGARIRRKDWPKESYISIKNLGLHLSPVDTQADNWEVYEEPIDWDCIIKKKCLCWFWDGDGSQTINKLQCVGEGEFYDDCCRTWENCRPVRKDEVTFYEDNKDE